MALTEQIRALVGEELTTKRGRPFQVVRVTDNTITYRAAGTDRSGQVRNYVAILEHLRAGNRINGPGDIEQVCPGDRNRAYEWAVLKRLGVLQ